MPEPIIRTYDKKIYKKCTKCRAWKPKVDILDEDTEEVREKRAFGINQDAEDNLSTICIKCKNKPSMVQQNKNVRARLRHHIATRATNQLGDHKPDNFTRDLEIYLGYRVATLVNHLRAELHKKEGAKRKLRDALDEGYHVDHIKPLMLWADDIFDEVPGTGEIEINWTAFQECWAINNLVAIPGAENLAKGATFEEPDSGHTRLTDDPSPEPESEPEEPSTNMDKGATE